MVKKSGGPAARPDTVHGRVGELAYDFENGVMQCHWCGAWVRYPVAHIRRHGISVREYRRLFELSAPLPLSGPWSSPAPEPDEVLPDGTPVFGKLGVLTYDAVEDRVQCHFCGAWMRSLGMHVKMHRITADVYREMYGLNKGNSAGVPSLTEKRSRTSKAIGSERWLLPGRAGLDIWLRQKRDAPPPPPRLETLNQIRSPETAARRHAPRRPRKWTNDDELLAALHAAQKENGGILTWNALEERSKTGQMPSAQLAVRRLGSWRRVCELLGQPFYRDGPHPSRRRWTDEQILDAVRDLERRLGRRATQRDLEQGRGGRGPSRGVPGPVVIWKRFGGFARLRVALDERLKS